MTDEFWGGGLEIEEREAEACSRASCLTSCMPILQRLGCKQSPSARLRNSASGSDEQIRSDKASQGFRIAVFLREGDLVHASVPHFRAGAAWSRQQTTSFRARSVAASQDQS